MRTFSKEPDALEGDRLPALSYRQKVTGITDGDKEFLFSAECDREKGHKGIIEVHRLTAGEQKQIL